MIRITETAFESVAESLRFEQSLLEEMERGDPQPQGTLHLWESPRYSVVLGRSGKVENEVDIVTCQQDNVPVVRRISGGGVVLVGPGCLNYGLVLSLDAQPELHDIRQSFCILLGSLAASLNLQVGGASDLALGDRKVSGNAQRRTRHALLQHGTLLNNFDLPKIGRYVKHPTREPAYRNGRSHVDFVGNIPLTPSELKSRLINTWVNL